MTLPNFIVIGAAKSGTTSLLSYLGQHPDVFVSRWKEPNYFALSGQEVDPRGPAPATVLRQMLYNWSIADLQTYTALFDGADTAKAIGEGSVRYLYFETAARRIWQALPEARLVVILRDPVARLYSHYMMNRQMQLEPLELRAALAAEDNRIACGWGWDWHYLRAGLYGAQLQRYYDLFPRAQISVSLYDDFLENPQAVFSSICQHIGVDADFVPDMTRRSMVSSLPRNLWLDRRLNWPSRLRSRLLKPPYRDLARPALDRLNRWNSRPVPPLDKRLRQELASLFSTDIDLLSDLLGRKIPWYSRT